LGKVTRCKTVKCGKTPSIVAIYSS